jgi:hypothetical protein
LIPDTVARQFSSAETLSDHCQVRREVAELRMSYLSAKNTKGLASVDRKIQDILPRTRRDLKQRLRKGS